MIGSSNPSTKASPYPNSTKARATGLKAFIHLSYFMCAGALTVTIVTAVRELSRTLAIIKREYARRDCQSRIVVSCASSGSSHATFERALDAVRRGKGVVVIDPKGDSRVLRELLRVASEREITPRAWREQLEDLLWTGADEHTIAEAMLPNAWFSSPHHLSVAKRHVVHEVRVLRARGLAMDVDALDRFFDPLNLRLPLGYLPKSDVRREVELYLESLTSAELAILGSVLSTLRTRLNS